MPTRGPITGVHHSRRAIRRPAVMAAVICICATCPGAPVSAYSPPVSAWLEAAARPRLAELSQDFFPGTWETRNVEFGQDVTIIWTLWGSGRLAYSFVVDGVASDGSAGHWTVANGVMIERWLRRDGTEALGRGSVEKIDDNTIRLTIIDNGGAAYRGLSRVYRRRAPAQVSQRIHN